MKQGAAKTSTRGGTDFSYNDSNWPTSRKILADALIDVPDEEARCIAEHNARRLYRFPRP